VTHQRETDLLAVGAVVAAVATRRERIPLGQPLEVRAGHVVEQQVVLQGEELPEARSQMLLDRLFVRQEPIQRAVEPIVVDPLGGQPEQILERGLAIPVLGDVQLARRFTQPRDHQHRRHLRPRHGLSACRQERGAQLLQSQRPPQRPSQPDVAERARALHAQPLESDRDGLFSRRRLFEQLVLLAPAGDLLREQPRPRAPLAVEFAEVRDRFLHHLPAVPHRAHQPPVPVRPSALPHHRVPQVHPTPPRTRGYRYNARASQGQKVGTTPRFRLCQANTPRPTCALFPKNLFSDAQLGKLG